MFTQRHEKNMLVKKWLAGGVTLAFSEELASLLRLLAGSAPTIDKPKSPRVPDPCLISALCVRVTDQDYDRSPQICVLEHDPVMILFTKGLLSMLQPRLPLFELSAHLSPFLERLSRKWSVTHLLSLARICPPPFLSRR